MHTNLSELLRNFPKVRHAALGGERVVIRTREGNLVLMADRPRGRSLFDKLSANIDSQGLTETDSSTRETGWDRGL